MTKIVRETVQQLSTKLFDQQAASNGRAAKGGNVEREQDAAGQQQAGESRPTSRGRLGTRIEDALSAPAKSKNPFNRFLVQVDRENVDPGTGRSFGQMIERQAMKGRPLIIARCLCNKHAQDADKKNRFSHAEFMDGNIAYEALQNQLYEKVIVREELGYFRPATEQRKHIDSFVSRDLEFWAINPFTKTYDVIADRAAVIATKSGPGDAVEALLFSDLKLLSEEDEDDHTFAYVAAGLYHSGSVVHKDEDLAAKAISLMKNAALPFSQADGLRLALDINIDVFTSLIKLGVDPKESDEQGWSMVDVARSKLQGDKQQAALAVLKQHGYV